jgi:O-antigen/teichoic acid export membrane protein
MSLTKKVLFNTSVQFVGKIVNTLIGLASVAIITRYLGVAGYGDYTTAFAYIMFFSVISDFGFFWIIVRKIAAGEDIKKVIQASQALRLLFSTGIFLVSLLLVLFLPYSATLKIALIMVAVSIFWMSQNSVYLALFQAKMRMDWPVIAETIGRVLGLGLMLVAIYLGLDFLWIVAAGLSASLFNFIFNLFFGWRYTSFGFYFHKPLMRTILFESAPVGLITILGLIYFRIDTVLLSLFKGSIDVGIYGTAYKILEILMALPGMFVASVFPAISAAHTQNDNQRVKTLIQKSFDALSIGAFAVMALFFSLATPTINLVAGKEFLITSTTSIFGVVFASDKVLQILIIAVGLSFWTNLFSNALISIKKQGSLIRPYIFATAVNVVLNLILIPKFSYVAAALVTIITQLILLVYCLVLVRRSTELKVTLSVFIKSFIAGLIIVVVGLLIKNWNFFISLPILLVSYILILLAIKAFFVATIKKIIKA